MLIYKCELTLVTDFLRKAAVKKLLKVVIKSNLRFFFIRLKT
jgi:hypothetical protein